jgi:DNA helicase II / ATP-dependent DNA helicase PcrA
MIQLRPHQAQILEYTSGKMGVSAVPGSGKTWTLSRLAADIIRRGLLQEDQEVLVVTLVNSAVDNFNSRVRLFLTEAGQLPNLGYRVRTLHGLAHDIVRQRPSLVGLDSRFTIVDEREANSILSDVCRAWLRSNPDALDDYLKQELEETQREQVRRQNLLDLVQEMAGSFIRSAKDQQLTPDVIARQIQSLPLPLPLAEMGSAMYTDYQRSLAYRGGVDFDDLIRLALRALELDPDYCQRLHDTWPYILEDEAQDSSQLQERILAALSGPTGNWVRVGDPNQAIYETFTTANPRYLREFLDRPDVLARHLPTSGRSSMYIIELANTLVGWTNESHPNPTVRDALSRPPEIEPTGPGDPQPNPPGSPPDIVLHLPKLSPEKEIQAVAESLARWVPDNPGRTVAVLAPRNERAFELVAELERRGIPYIDSLLRSSSDTRISAKALRDVLAFLADPKSTTRLVEAYKAWRREELLDPAARKNVLAHCEQLRRLVRVEDYLWPGAEGEWLDTIEFSAPDAHLELSQFRETLKRWQRAILLPVDGLLLTVAQDLLCDAGDLALAHKLAVLLRRASEVNPTWRLPELISELSLIADNQRRFLGFSSEDTGVDTDQHKGKVWVATMHKAKGLEWDRVYLMSVNDYDFPAGQLGESFIAEKWWLRDNLNLAAETLEQLSTLFSSDEYDWYREGFASQAARVDYARERMRLLYVGITRARQELIITWNTGRRASSPAHPAAPLLGLKEYWERKYPPPTS